MFRWFETRLNPYPPEEPGQPPEGLFAFCWYYTRTAAPFLVIMSVITALISVEKSTFSGFWEILLIGFLPRIQKGSSKEKEVN